MAPAFQHRMDELDLELSSYSSYSLWTKRVVSMLDDLSDELESGAKDMRKRLRKTTLPTTSTGWSISRYVAARHVTSGIFRAGEEAFAAARLIVKSHKTFNGLYVVRHGSKSTDKFDVNG